MNKKLITWFGLQWRSNPLFSTAIALLAMIVLQTLALGTDFASFGEWWSSFCVNWINVLRNNASVGIVALGMALVIISGGIDKMPPEKREQALRILQSVFVEYSDFFKENEK